MIPIQTRSMFQFSGAVGLLLAIVGQAPAQSENSDKTPAAADQVKTTRFVLHPAEVPYAAMKYWLLPKYIEQTPGNAAPHYFRAILVWGNNKVYRDMEEKISDWAELPLADLRDNEEANAFLNNCPTYDFDLIRLAARREFCDWELPFREQSIETKIPELQKMRELAWLVALKARMAMARGNIDEAVDNLKTGLALARDSAKGPTLINGLVGVAIANVILKQVETLVQQPRCPNLYWTLTALPDPVIDLRPAMEMEQDNVYLLLPSLRDLRGKKLSETQWNSLLVEVAQKILAIVPKDSSDAEFWGKGVLFVATAYPKARSELARAGYTPPQIDAMSMSQAILLAVLEAYEATRDEIFKWAYVPYPSATEGMSEAEQQLAKESKEGRDIMPLTKLLMPALQAVRFAQVRLSREVAALRCVEAVRLYAAQHKDQLPERLSDIKEVPLSADPSTGKPFGYERTGGSAILSSAVPPGYEAKPDYALRWELSLAPPKK